MQAAATLSPEGPETQMCKKGKKTKQNRISGCPETELTLRQEQKAGVHTA